ncbi:MAG: DegT/DnrJ/EryC1/StrS family aminotransferase, partial [Deltaproteobacteria bacterium]|nr:DegT/DnrJ/EryC1/StrS family aminotransferase [Deltaproteobacteria bacterium]
LAYALTIHKFQGSEVPCAIVEDAAQALGALWRPGAARGVAAAISFFPTKNLGAIGDAGAIVTDDDALADRLTLLRNHGARPKYHHVLLGGNFRLDALQAAVLATRLPHFEAAVAARRARAAIYDRLLRDAVLPPELRMPAPHPEHTWHQYVIRAPRRDALRTHLAAAGIATEIYYPEPLHLQSCFADLGYRAGSMPVAERAAAEVLALPIQPALSIDQQAAVVDAIAGFYRAGSQVSQ